MRQCRKCGKEFKFWHKVDGKKRNCSGRKFCFDCSPYKGHNTKPDDPSRISNPHPRNGQKAIPYREWSNERKQKTLKRYYDRGVERKQKLLEIKGGQCIKCGYCKCSRALEFHHRDPKTKNFSLTMREIAGFAWDTVLAELNKCDLVCSNCHREIEDEQNRSKYSE